jgi:small-conductance mechanosensitive channel
VDGTQILSILVPLVTIGVLLGGGYLTARSFAGWLRKRGAQPGLVRGARVFVMVIAGLLAVVVFFAAFGPIGAISSLTLSAVIGLAATLALQTTISNILAGFVLLQDRLLRLHDTVQISGIKGQVVQIGLVTTWLKLDDGSVAVISNSNLLSGPLVNRTAADRLKGEI